MRHSDGSFTVMNRVERGLLRGMRHIDENAHLVHTSYRLPAQGCNPSGARLHASTRQRSRVVVCKPDDAHSQTMEQVNVVQIVVQMSRVLKVEDDSTIARSVDAVSVCC